MANEKNLKPFKKGQSGNPAGRKKGTLRDIKVVLQDLLSQETRKDVRHSETLKRF